MTDTTQGQDQDIGEYLRSTGVSQAPPQQLERETQEYEKGSVRAKQEKLLASAPERPEPPKYHDVPKAPQQQFQDPTQALGGPAMFLAAMGSLLTRRPMQTAMDSMTAIMNGNVKGQEKGMELERENFHNAIEATLQQNKVESERYNSAMEKYKGKTNDLMAKMFGIANENNDPLMQMALKNGDMNFAASLVRDRETQAQRVFQNNMEMRKQEETERYHKELTGGVGGDLGTMSVGSLIANYKMAPCGSFGRQSQQCKQLMAKVQEINPDYDAKIWFGGLAEEKARAPAITRADSAALTQATKMNTALGIFEDTAIKNGDALVQLARKVDKTGVPVVERWIRSGRQALGDPDIAEFMFQMNAFRAEVAKIISNPNLTGVLTDTSRREVQEGLPNAASASQIEAIVRRARQDFTNRRTAVKSHMEELRGRLGAEAPAAADETPGGAGTGTDWQEVQPGVRIRAKQ